MIRNAMLLFSVFTTTFCYGQNDSIFNYTDTIFKVGQTYSLPIFRTNRCGSSLVYYQGPTRNDSIMDSIYVFLVKNPAIKIEIIKHSDSRFSISSDLIFTQTKVDLIKIYLINKGIEANRIIAIGKGETEPIYTEEECNKYHIIDSNKFEQMHATNRRTIIKIIEF